MLESLIALGSAAAQGAGAMLTRRGVLRASSNYIANVSIIVGVILFFLICIVNGDLFRLGTYSWQTLVYFILAGVVHFAIGRTFAYESIRLIGATRSNMVSSLNIMVTAVLAVIVFADHLTLRIILGIILSVSGPLLMTFKENVSKIRQVSAKEAAADPPGGPRGNSQDRRVLYMGILYAVGTAVLWGSSAIFIKLGLQSGGSPYGGIFIAYLASLIAISPRVLNKGSIKEFNTVKKGAFNTAVWNGIATSTAQMLKYIALGKGSLILTALLFRTAPIWVLVFAFLFNRKNESFTRWVLIGDALLLAGIILAET